MSNFYSDYYERHVDLSKDEAEILVNIYLEIAEEKGFQPDVSDSYLLLEDSYLYDTVAYHVDEFGKEKDGYDFISHLFE